MICPDDKMDSPIENVLFWTGQFLKRCKIWVNRPEEWEALPERFRYNEERFRETYLAVLTLRAREVVDYCDSIGLTGCTESRVRENPFLIAAVIRSHFGDPEFRK